MKHPKIISTGEVLWDLFPEGKRFGGAPANFACHAAILGADVLMVSAVGDDRNGREALGILQRYGVDISLVQVISDAPTGTVGVKLDTAGKPTFTIGKGAAWDRLAWNNELQSRVVDADALYFGTLGQRSHVSRETIRHCVDAARDASVPRIVDINLRPPFFDTALIRDSIARASILKISDDELSAVCAACGIDTVDAPDILLRRLLAGQSLDLVVMTCGARGAMLATSSEVVTQPGIKTEVRDTVGAGDAFTASFLLSVLRDEPVVDNLTKACAIAAAVCSHSGAVPVTSTPNQFQSQPGHSSEGEPDAN